MGARKQLQLTGCCWFSYTWAVEGSSKAGVSNSIYLGATRGRVWVRLGRIKYSTKKYK